MIERQKYQKNWVMQLIAAKMKHSHVCGDDNTNSSDKDSFVLHSTIEKALDFKSISHRFESHLANFIQ